MFIVKFVRKDGKSDEEYYYHTLQEAETHQKLFDDDDSDLYERIEIIPRLIEYFCWERLL